ncbi:MAG: YdeI/OmpD-associated family protein [Ornithinimicrobium sp.]
MAYLGGSEERTALFFDGPADFRHWLEEHHATELELWMGLRRKHMHPRGLTWEEAVPEALCFGWIDSRAERIDAGSRRQRWTPRKPTSTWSRVNLDLVDALMEQGRMRPSGIAAWEKRRVDHQAAHAQEQAATMRLPAEYDAALTADGAARAFWDHATPGYRRACILWVCSAKQQGTRDRRMEQLVELCATGRLIPQQRYGTMPAWVAEAAAAAAARSISTSDPPPHREQPSPDPPAAKRD